MKKGLLWIATILVILSGVSGWARRRRDTPAKRSTDQLRWRRSSEIQLDNQGGCSFLIQDRCCTKPTFNNCEGTELLGMLPLNATSDNNVEAAAGSETLPYTRSAQTDEAGCQLRRVLYKGRELCIPGNMAYMLTIIDRVTDGKCFPVFPDHCSADLVAKDRYYFHVYMAGEEVEKALRLLKEAGHVCEEETSESVRCLI